MAKKSKKPSINWEKVIGFGVGLGFAFSVLYLLLLITASVAR